MATAMLHELFRLRDMDDFPGPFALRARQVSEGLREMWERTSREAVLNRRLAELHAARDDYRALLDGHIRLLEDYLSLSEIHERAFGSNPIWVTELRRAVAKLKGLHDELFPRWQTANDLHQLMVEKFSVQSDALRALAAESPPPSSWAAETIDPFSAD